MVHALTTDDYYDILAANERILEESRRLQRLSIDPPRNVQLQEKYLNQAANLGLIPSKFATSPPPLRYRRTDSPPSQPASPAAANKADAQRPVPPPGFGGGRPSRNRIAKELSRAESSNGTSSATAALAATLALYKGPVPPAPLSPLRTMTGGPCSDTSSDSELTHGSVSSVSTSSGLGTFPGPPVSRFGAGRWASSDGSSSTVSSRSESSPARWLERQGGEVARELARTFLTGRRGGSDSGEGPGKGLEPNRTHLGSKAVGRLTTSGGGGGGGSGGGGGGGGTGKAQQRLLVKEPSPAFMRRWRAVRRKRVAKKQAVRFLLSCPADAERDSQRGATRRIAAGSGASTSGAGGAAKSPTTSSGGSPAGSGSTGGAGGVFIVYPGSSVIFPAQPLPYSLEEALQAVRQEQQQQQQQQQQQPPVLPPPTLLPLSPQWRQVQFEGQPPQRHEQLAPVPPGLGQGLGLGPAGAPWSTTSASFRLRWPEGSVAAGAPGQPQPYLQDDQRGVGPVLEQRGPQTPQQQQQQQYSQLPPRDGWDVATPPRAQLAQPYVSPWYDRYGDPAQQRAPTAALDPLRRHASSPGDYSAVTTVPMASATGADWQQLGPEQTPQRWRDPPSPLYGMQPLGYRDATPGRGDAAGALPGAPRRLGSSAAGGPEEAALGAAAVARVATWGGGSNRGSTVSSGAGAGAAKAGGTPWAPATPQAVRPTGPPPASSTGSLTGGSISSTADVPGGASVPPTAPRLVPERRLDGPVFPAAQISARSYRAAPPPVDVASASSTTLTHGSDALPSPSTPPPPPTAAQLEAAAALPEDPHGSVDGRSSSLGGTSGGPSFGVWAGGAPSSRGVPSVGSAAGWPEGPASSRGGPPSVGSGGAWAEGSGNPKAGPPSVGSEAAGSAASLRSLRDQQSVITRDVQALMQRLADMRGKLDK